jgi:hypothetical protein
MNKQMLQAQLIMWAGIVTGSIVAITFGFLVFYFAVKWVVKH